MKKLMKFVDQKKTDARFKKAGQGHVLGDSDASSSSEKGKPGSKPVTSQPKSTPRSRNESTNAAAQAALARKENQTKMPISGATLASKPKTKVMTGTGGSVAMDDDELASLKLQAKMMQKAREAKAAQDSTPTMATSKDIKSADVSSSLETSTNKTFDKISTVQYICALDGYSADYQGTLEHINQYLEQHKSSSLEGAVAMMVTSQKSNPGALETCIATLKKYSDNVQKGEKFHRIRLGNQAFQDRVAQVSGAVEFLNHLGFQPTEEEGEAYLRLPESEVEGFQARSENAFSVLGSASPITPKLDRNLKIFKPEPNQNISNVTIPDSFFVVTKDDVRLLAHQKKEEREKELSLRTQEMREADKAKNRRKYQYTILRCIAQDGAVMEATFHAEECVSDLATLLSENVSDPAQPFSICKQPGGKILDNFQKTLEEEGLVPSAVLRVDTVYQPLT
eukprot:m.51154 g.51154  ORF g.51154 m.51154 type:complete len:452 (+) comp10713_c0_seq3:251-1606(+)